MTVALMPPPDQEPPDTGTIPPQDIAAERAVLGSMLLSKQAIEDCYTLEPEDFYRPNHETIYRAIHNVSISGTAADAITVADYLHGTGDLSRVGGTDYLHALIESVATYANASHYAEIVARASAKRRVIQAGMNIVRDGHAASVDTEPDDIIDAARTTLDQIVSRHADVPTVNPSDVYDAIDTIGEAAGIPTPWTSLTDAIAGWRAGEMYVVAADTGVGKTIVGVNTALHVAEQGLPSVTFSMEMPRKQLYWRMLSQVGRVPMNRIVANTLEDHHHQKLQVAARHISPLPLVVDDRSGVTLSQIRAAVRAAKRDHGKLGIVVVDQASLMLVVGTFGTREQEVAHLSKGFKAIAKDFDVPVMVLSQINDDGKLRESRALGHDASVVIHMERDLTSAETSVDMNFLVKKNRHGACTSFTLPFAGHYSTIYDEGGSAG